MRPVALRNHRDVQGRGRLVLALHRGGTVTNDGDHMSQNNATTAQPPCRCTICRPCRNQAADLNTDPPLCLPCLYGCEP